MCNSNIKVSVIIPFYNHLDWLKEAILSVIEQTYKNIEIIIVNDGSKYDLSDIKSMDHRIVVLNKLNGGPASARNVGLENATGEYVAFLDSDDKWLPTKVQVQLDYMVRKNYKWSHHSYKMFRENETLDFKEIVPKNCEGNVLLATYLSFKGQTSSFMIENKFLRENEISFPENRRYGQDIEFFRGIAVKENLGFLNQPLSRFRIRGNNAGFRPDVQINFRHLSWLEIQSNEKLKNGLPKTAIFAYKVNELIYKNINIKSDSKMTLLYYFLPYIMFKIANIQFEIQKRGRK
ncbi:glycosyltransferase family 2 protein [Exiguobacterium sp. USCH10]|uniref:glycosyltransferase family 2 protein n=1 Tax=Exiguobacterium sp. USCH10 TaxID=3024839 RepID=UPI0030A3A5E0